MMRSSMWPRRLAASKCSDSKYESLDITTSTCYYPETTQAAHTQGDDPMPYDPDDKYLINVPEGEKNPGDDLIQPPGAPSRPPQKIEIRKGFDDKGNPLLKTVTTIDEVPEEHIYLVYRSHALDAVIEADLLGDQVVTGSDGRLPPVIHLECPRCTSKDNNNRSILSITYGNKHFEIEDLEEKDWGIVMMPDGKPVVGSKGRPAVIKRRLTVKETIKCTYCNRVFRITDNIMSDA